MTINALLKFLLLCVVFTATYSVVEGDVEDVPLEYKGDQDTFSLSAVFKRAAKTPKPVYCLPWRAPCTLDDALIRKYPFLNCCNSGACKCNLFGNNCRCEATLRSIMS
ncbi:unnamed protein product [Candidula unifasciata]|uniref:Uncharacterized protein n=1 Tax=Candidula unifasciata TaxID=100452 RepID=A0A8S3ZJE3_9EUPU|nr:unnamed protein product [Candidula unifasciata]